LGELGLKDFDPINESFVCRKFLWERIRQNAGEVHVYNSDNDPYVPLSKGQELAERLGVKLTVVHDAGHINASAGFRTFPLLLQELLPLIGEVRR
jgi:predicted alpha/beta hydrolase family esterase